MLASSCIKEADPYEIATEDQVTLETLIEGIPASLVQAGSAGYASEGQAWDFALPAIHIATESMTGDVAIGGNIGYDWFAQWGTNEALGADYAVGALTWNNYYAWIMAANNVIKQIDASDFATLDATQKSYLGFAYAYRAMFYLDLVRLYEFKENNYTEAPGVLGLGVPIVLPETTEAEAKNNPRAKVDDIYDQVIFPDLDKAEELLSGFTAPDKYTISPALVYGLKARAWLERGTAKNDAEAYVSAAEYARLAINASGCTPLTQEQRSAQEVIKKSAIEDASKSKDAQTIAEKRLLDAEESLKKSEEATKDKESIIQMLTVKLKDSEEKLDGYEELRKSEASLRDQVTQLSHQKEMLERDLAEQKRAAEQEQQLAVEKAANKVKLEMQEQISKLRYEKTRLEVQLELNQNNTNK